MPTERWLVTGASGQLGGHVVAQLARDAARPTIRALTGRQNLDFQGVDTARVDLSDLDVLRQSVSEFAPTHIVHLGAMTVVSDCLKNPDDAQRVNVDATRTLAESAASLGARLVFSSTDMVFDGDHAPYRESDPPQPLSHYGRTKAAAEAALAEFDDALVVRIPLLFGFSITPRQTTFGKMVSALRAGEPLRLFTDEFRTPVWLVDAARALIGLARSDEHGLLHVAGPERLSRFDLIGRCADLLGINAPALEPISRLDIEAGEPRPADLSLDGSRFNRHFPALAPGPPRAEVFAS
jgi:dTDP-4-dehydrorhamnose reductase